jgi:hypothetical protein
MITVAATLIWLPWQPGVERKIIGILAQKISPRHGW